MSLNRNQSQIQGGAREVQAPPLFLDQKEARKKLYLETGTPPNPLSKGLDDRPPPSPHLISRSGSGTGDSRLLVFCDEESSLFTFYNSYFPLKFPERNSAKYILFT